MPTDYLLIFSPPSPLQARWYLYLYCPNHENQKIINNEAELKEVNFSWWLLAIWQETLNQWEINDCDKCWKQKE